MRLMVLTTLVASAIIANNATSQQVEQAGTEKLNVELWGGGKKEVAIDRSCKAGISRADNVVLDESKAAITDKSCNAALITDKQNNTTVIKMESSEETNIKLGGKIDESSGSIEVVIPANDRSIVVTKDGYIIKVDQQGNAYMYEKHEIGSVVDKDDIGIFTIDDGEKRYIHIIERTPTPEGRE